MEELKMSADIAELAKALSAFQGEIETVLKRKNVNMTTRKGGNVNYDFASLADIKRVTKIPLARAGLAVSQQLIVDGHGRFFMATLILHASGQFMLWRAPVPFVGMPGDSSSAQAHGSLITYARRYAYCSALDIATDDQLDDDGNKYVAQIGQVGQQEPQQYVQQQYVQVETQQPQQAQRQMDPSWSDNLKHYIGVLDNCQAPNLVASILNDSRQYMNEAEQKTFKRMCADRFTALGGRS